MDSQLTKALKYVLVALLALALVSTLLWPLKTTEAGAVTAACTVLATVVGGAWAFTKFAHERSAETALEMKLDYETAPTTAGLQLVWIKTRLKNVGKVGITAKPRPDLLADGKTAPESHQGALYTYADGEELLGETCCLEIKKLKEKAVAQPALIDWFDDAAFDLPLTNDDEIEVLADYEDPQKGNDVDFWMEPGETYDLSTLVALSPGNYLAKVTFLGNRGPTEFWTRTILVTVPKPTTTAKVD